MEEIQEEVIVFEEPQYGVYIKLDDNNVVIGINSDAFMNDTTGWIKIDSGNTDREHHAQGNYLPSIDNLGIGLFDDEGRFSWKYVDNALALLTDEEKQALFPTPEPVPTLEERLTTNEELAEEAYLKSEENSVLIEIYMG